MTIRARVRAYGRRYRVDFGTNHEGWNVERARVELDRILRQVERGTWEPPSGENGSSGALDAEESVHVTASRWWQRRKAELAPNTRLDYRWRLDHVVESLPAALRDRHSAALPLFPTRTGRRLNPSNIRNRLLNGMSAPDGKPPTKGVVERANAKRAAEGRMLLPTSVTPHTLRRTFASLCFFAAAISDG